MRLRIILPVVWCVVCVVAPSKTQADVILSLCGNKGRLIDASQAVHVYLKEHAVPHIWNVDGFGHDRETWASNLYHFTQLLFR